MLTSRDPLPQTLVFSLIRSFPGFFVVDITFAPSELEGTGGDGDRVAAGMPSTTPASKSADNADKRIREIIEEC
jgi:hypothetical protein